MVLAQMAPAGYTVSIFSVVVGAGLGWFVLGDLVVRSVLVVVRRGEFL